MAELAAFLGDWDGPVELAGSPGLLRLEVRAAEGGVPEDAARLLLTCDPVGFYRIELTGVVGDGGLNAGEGPFKLSAKEADGSLTGTLSLGHGLADATFDLRRGHPDGERFRVPRAAGWSGESNQLRDGWINGPLLATELVTQATNGRLAAVDSLLIARGGELVTDEYFFGRGPADLHTWQSCTKSITSLLVGLLVDGGRIGSVDDPVWRYLPHRRGRRWIDEMYDVTLHQVLSMSAGLDWDEKIPYSHPGNDAVLMNRSPDWVGYVLDKPLRESWPAGAFEYQSGLTLLLGELIRTVAGVGVSEFARGNLFAPLGISNFMWLTAADGTTHTGGGLFMAPRDVAKLGELVLRRGEWRGKRVLSTDWIDKSTSRQSSDELTDYAYQWWLPRIEGSPITASGYGGQCLAIYRDLDAVVVTTAHSWQHDSSATGHYPALSILERIPGELEAAD